MLAYLKFKFAKKDTTQSLEQRQQEIQSQGVPKPIPRRKIVVHVDESMTSSDDLAQNKASKKAGSSELEVL